MFSFQWFFGFGYFVFLGCVGRFLVSMCQWMVWCGLGIGRVIGSQRFCGVVWQRLGCCMVDGILKFRCVVFLFMFYFLEQVIGQLSICFVKLRFVQSRCQVGSFLVEVSWVYLSVFNFSFNVFLSLFKCICKICQEIILFFYYCILCRIRGRVYKV